ncbi:MAG: hypothetical protein M2R45_02166 [Verrucomicrobia subdivision 3 bacterium]|nr:hypothetical protein [Limisphaerales bacterium]MCS1413742.1 hypothetical protein [Limisphaerales bacterium]
MAGRITTREMGGVQLAALKRLRQQTLEQETEIEHLRAERKSMYALVQKLLEHDEQREGIRHSFWS